MLKIYFSFFAVQSCKSSMIQYAYVVLKFRRILFLKVGENVMTWSLAILLFMLSFGQACICLYWIRITDSIYYEYVDIST